MMSRRSRWEHHHTEDKKREWRVKDEKENVQRAPASFLVPEEKCRSRGQWEEC